MSRAPAVLQATWGYLQDSLRLLALSLALADAQEPACYRLVAVQLRILLCDTTRRHGRIEDISLAARCLPSLRLPHLSRPDAPPLERQAWLGQGIRLPSGSMHTVREIVRFTCDRDGGAHVDPPAWPQPGYRAALLGIARAALPALTAAAAGGPFFSDSG